MHKKPLWLTYTSKIQLKGKRVKFEFKNDTLDISFEEIHSIMFYGSVCPLTQDFLEKCSFYKIPVVIHRRNMISGVWLMPSTSGNRADYLTSQILFRQNQKKSSYITKRLLLAKFKSMEWLIPSPFQQLHKMTDTKKMIAVEAWHARCYWKMFYEKLSLSNVTRRQKNVPVNQALDAVSKFISGIVLRWVVYHHLSPTHGFTHIPTDYPALIYDLMEPYRGYTDKVVFEVAKNLKTTDSEKLTMIAISELKTFLDTQIYTNATKQIVTFHELYHGLVLALVSYLSGNRRFIVPLPGKPNGGRPIQAGYKLYGKKAGISNF